MAVDQCVALIARRLASVDKATVLAADGLLVCSEDAKVTRPELIEVVHEEAILPADKREKNYCALTKKKISLFYP